MNENLDPLFGIEEELERMELLSGGKKTSADAAKSDETGDRASDGLGDYASGATEDRVSGGLGDYASAGFGDHVSGRTGNRASGGFGDYASGGFGDYVSGGFGNSAAGAFTDSTDGADSGDGIPQEDISAMLDEFLAEPEEPAASEEERTADTEPGRQGSAQTGVRAGTAADQGWEQDEMEISEAVAVVPADMVITGNMVLESDIRIYGRVEGDIRCAGSVTLLGGRMEGRVEANALRLEGGSMKGDAAVTGDVILEAGTELEGNVTTQNFRSDAKNTGDVKAGGSVDILEHAVVSGSITAAAFSVAAGAKIKGMVIVEAPAPEPEG